MTLHIWQSHVLIHRCTGHNPTGARRSAAVGHAGAAHWRWRPAVCPWRWAVPCDANSVGTIGRITERKCRAGRSAVAGCSTPQLLRGHGAPSATSAAQLSGVCSSQKHVLQWVMHLMPHDLLKRIARRCARLHPVCSYYRLRCRGSLPAQLQFQCTRGMGGRHLIL
jgi:hypothetical protein